MPHLLPVIDRNDSFSNQRAAMVEGQLMARGIEDEEVLSAMLTVPREEFVDEAQREFSYYDSPLPIGFGQTISQPYMVALMLELLLLRRGRDRVLEVGAGSGYASAVLAQIAEQVFAIEWYPELAVQARERMERLGYTNVQVIQGDGSAGLWSEAPFDAILVSAGGVRVPRPLREQLTIGGRLVIPVGESREAQELLRIRRESPGRFSKEYLGGVRFVPLLGKEGWEEERSPGSPRFLSKRSVSRLIVKNCEKFERIETVELTPMLQRIGESRVVLLGGSTHGTAEFYRMRTRITQDLIERKGFRIVALEADWSDTVSLDSFVRGEFVSTQKDMSAKHFPQWMWRNQEVLSFLQWLRSYNATVNSSDEQVGVTGLDLYSFYGSVSSMLECLAERDPALAREARERYECLSPWEGDPVSYEKAALSKEYEDCEQEISQMLHRLLSVRLSMMRGRDESLFQAIQSARVVADAQRYYRELYYNSARSWNLRDLHMFETLKVLMKTLHPNARAVVWGHNSHIGDARATEMAARGEVSIGQLCRTESSLNSYHIGFGLHSGAVMAAKNWGGEPVQLQVNPSIEGSYEYLCHNTDISSFLLPLREANDQALRSELLHPRLERVIGVVYRPERERYSHYFQAVLPEQFDEYVWFNNTKAVSALPPVEAKQFTESSPFGL